MRGTPTRISEINSGRSRLVMIILRWKAGMSFDLAAKTVLIRFSITSNESSSHSSSPSRMQYIGPSTGSCSIASKILQSVIDNLGVNRDSFWISKLDWMWRNSCGRCCNSWKINPLIMAEAVLRFSSLLSQKYSRNTVFRARFAVCSSFSARKIESVVLPLPGPPDNHNNCVG